MKLLVKNIGQLVSVCDGKQFLAGKDMANIKISDGCLAIAVDDDGKIAMVGSQQEVTEKYNEKMFSKVLDAGGKAVLPGKLTTSGYAIWQLANSKASWQGIESELNF